MSVSQNLKSKRLSMTFYSGFSLKDDILNFEQFLKPSDLTLCGFSYGAIKAFKEALETSKRIDTLQLFSPAFFQNRDKKFKRLQLMAYKKNQIAYTEQFIEACFAPLEVGNHTLNASNENELEELLTFVWDESDLEKLMQRGIKIEVYLGSEDKIVDANIASEFFRKYATVYYINGANHFLQTK